MKYVNLKELNALRETGLSLSQLAKHYGVDLFHLNNFIWSHKGRNGTYPVDGTRSRAPVRTKYKYPSKVTICKYLETMSVNQIAQKLEMPYDTLYKYINSLQIDPNNTKTLKRNKKDTDAEIIDVWKKIIK